MVIAADKSKISGDMERALITAALQPYEFLNTEGETTYDISSFLYDEKDWQDVLEKCGFPSNTVLDFLKWYPNREEWLVKLGVSREIIAIAKDQVEVDIPG